MKTCLILVLISWASAALAAPAWTWVDENGVRHYSDRPVEGAQRIDLPEFEGAGIRLSAPPSPASQSGRSQTEAPPERPEAQAYERIDVVSPAQQETLWNIEGTLGVEVDLSPALQPGHTLDVYLDGERMNLDATSTQLTVPEVFRGVHTLQAVVLDAAGREVVRSLAVTFMVQQTSILNPNNPNAPGGAGSN